MRRRAAGFTLIEILVVLSLLGVLMGLTVGYVQRIGTGNELIQTANSLANALASARAQAYGNSSSYVALETGKDEGLVLRSYRNRQVFHWPCEDFERASELGVLTREGAVDMADASAPPSREGRHVVFAGGKVSIRNTPWLQFVDGFSLECKIRPDSSSGLTKMVIFEKGDALEIGLVAADAGRLDAYAQVRLGPDEKGEGAGAYEIRTGERGPEKVPEWSGPLLPGRWYDLRVTYDRNAFEIQINGSVRAVRNDKRNAMKPDMEKPLVVGGGFRGGFDSLVVGGIFEDDEDRFVASENVSWVDAKGERIEKTAYVHFRNRGLDPREHSDPVAIILRLDQEDGQGPRRIVTVSLSGETFIKRPSQ